MQFANEYERAFKFFDVDKKLFGLQEPESHFTKQVFENFEFIVLYHSTSDIFLDEIKANGIKPNAVTGNSIEDNLETDPALVYLHNWTCGNQEFYGRRAVENFEGAPVTLECVVHLDDLEPDVNCIAPRRLKQIADDKIQQIIEGDAIGQFASKSVVTMLTRIIDQNKDVTILS